MNYSYNDLIEIFEKHNSDWDNYKKSIENFFYDLKTNLKINLKTEKDNILDFIDKDIDYNNKSELEKIKEYIKNLPSIEYKDSWSKTKLLFTIENDNTITDKNISYSSQKLIFRLILLLKSKKNKNNYILEIENFKKKFIIPIDYNETDLNKISDFIICEIYNRINNSLDNWLNNKNTIGFDVKSLIQ